MLLRQNLGRRHQRDLVAVFDGDDRRLEADNCLARSHVPLQQTPHGIRLLHVGSNFLQHPLLRGRGMKWQNLLDRRSHPIVETERYSGLRFLLRGVSIPDQAPRKTVRQKSCRI